MSSSREWLKISPHSFFFLILTTRAFLHTPPILYSTLPHFKRQLPLILCLARFHTAAFQTSTATRVRFHSDGEARRDNGSESEGGDGAAAVELGYVCVRAIGGAGLWANPQ